MNKWFKWLFVVCVAYGATQGILLLFPIIGNYKLFEMLTFIVIYGLLGASQSMHDKKITFVAEGIIIASATIGVQFMIKELAKCAPEALVIFLILALYFNRADSLKRGFVSIVGVMMFVAGSMFIISHLEMPVYLSEMFSIFVGYLLYHCFESVSAKSAEVKVDYVEDNDDEE